MGQQFTIADGYLFTVLSWGQHVNLDIGKWPQLKRFVERVGARPHVIEALKAEGQKK
jgi:glutathione S-transferase